MKNFLTTQLLVAALMCFFLVQAQAQLDPTPYLGSVTMNNGRVSIDWTFESAGGNDIVLKNDKGYVEMVIWKGNQYTTDKSKAMKFRLNNDGLNGSFTLRSAADPKSCYTHKGGNFVMHSYMHDGSSWTIVPKHGIPPAPYLGNVTMTNIEEPSTIDWTFESAGGNDIVLKNGQGYVKEVIFNGNKYTTDKGQAMQFFIDDNNPQKRLVLRSAANPESYYTRKGGNFVMHSYMHDGSTWTITKR